MSNTFPAKALSYCAVFLTVLCAPLHASAQVKESNQKIFVVTLTEDTTSEMYTILFYNLQNELVRVIDMWNGGHVGPALAHEYAVSGKQLTYVKSYDPLWPVKTMVKDVLCKKLKIMKDPDPPKLAYNELPIHDGEDRVPFSGCP